MTDKLSYKSKAVLSIFAVLIVIALLVLLAEGTVRLRQWVKYGMAGTVEDTYQADPKTGLRVPVPNSTVGNIQINSLGFRGPEIETPKSPSTVRLAFLGASTTYCAEVSHNEMAWPHLVWRRIQETMPRVEWDYVNAGVPGYTINSSRKNLQRRVKPLQPDVIVIYHATNDLSAHSRNLAVKQGLYQNAKTKKSWLSEYSLLWRLVEKNLSIWQTQQSAYDQNIKLEFDPKELSKPFEKDLRELIAESQGVAKFVAVATFSHRLRQEQSLDEKLEAASSALYYMPYMSIDGLLAAYDEYNRVIRTVARETGVLLIEGEKRIPGDEVHFADSVHFTDSGSYLMAERVSEALLRVPVIGNLAQTH